MGRRWVKVLTVTVVVLAALFVAADRIAVHLADNFVAKKADDKYDFDNNTTSYTTVDIHGFPFLTQALGRSFDHVTLTAGNLTSSDTAQSPGGYLTVAKVQLELHDVQVAPTFDSARSGSVTGTVTIGWADLSQAVGRILGASQVTVTPHSLTDGDPGPAAHTVAVRLAGRYDGRALSGDGSITADGNELRVSVPASGKPPADWPIDLPAGLAFGGLRTAHDGLVLLVTGQSVTLGASGTPLGN
ncbi:LmeA family phospholipid-binding protein [Streptantibioticus silvisoli]|uniref:DUF2993 domain-containing protein n=1 Tax=Streptantibioticus silvisoli TaxID=2705255 RepID=A0ABT6W6X9_9ACTN|nr:DUF2993 domain-containing protein [Streptantibioticus silvisoli]MDI5966145.1 DUF2993 domain-containing protein [Streptantibioticus silvisoli]